MAHRYDHHRTEVYRLYDASDRLLYVGITWSADSRLMQHVRRHWWPDVARREVSWHRTRAAALKAEARAIKIERPIYNGTSRAPHSQAELDYIRKRALAAVERAQLPRPGVRVQRRYDKAASEAVTLGLVYAGLSPAS